MYVTLDRGEYCHFDKFEKSKDSFVFVCLLEFPMLQDRCNLLEAPSSLTIMSFFTPYPFQNATEGPKA